MVYLLEDSHNDAQLAAKSVILNGRLDALFENVVQSPVADQRIGGQAVSGQLQELYVRLELLISYEGVQNVGVHGHYFA